MGWVDEWKEANLVSLSLTSELGTLVKKCRSAHRNISYQTSAEIEYASRLTADLLHSTFLLSTLQSQLDAIPEPSSLTSHRRNAITTLPSDSTINNPFLESSRAAKRRALKAEITETEERLSLLRASADALGPALWSVDHIWIPKTVGLLSRGSAEEATWIGLHRDWLASFVSRFPCNSFEPEKWIASLVGVPRPPRGVCEVRVELPGGQKLGLARPPRNRIPVLWNVGAPLCFSLFSLKLESF